MSDDRKEAYSKACDRAKAHAEHVKELTYVLLDFIECIDSTGGLIECPDGTVAPAADPGWTDLVTVYYRGCELASLEPLIEKVEQNFFVGHDGAIIWIDPEDDS